MYRIGAGASVTFYEMVPAFAALLLLKVVVCT
jgi:hypothetical protein